MLTTTANRKTVARLFASFACIIGGVSTSIVLGTAIYFSTTDASRQSAAVVTIASAVAFGCLLLGTACSGYAWFLGEKRLGIVGSLLCVFSFIVSLFVASSFSGQP